MNKLEFAIYYILIVSCFTSIAAVIRYRMYKGILQSAPISAEILNVQKAHNGTPLMQLRYSAGGRSLVSEVAVKPTKFLQKYFTGNSINVWVLSKKPNLVFIEQPTKAKLIFKTVVPMVVISYCLVLPLAYIFMKYKS